METTKNNSNTTTRFLLLTLASICFLVFSTSILLHLKPSLIINDIIDFAVHHYFLTGFLALVILLVSLKLYFKSFEKYSYNKVEKNNIRISRLLKRKQRLQHFTRSFSLKMQTVKSQPIDKSKIQDLYFSESDVLDNMDEIAMRNTLLITAMKLGNTYKHKAKIFFKDKFTNKHIETTVWHADSKHITLKGGITLPVKSVYKIEL